MNFSGGSSTHSQRVHFTTLLVRVQCILRTTRSTSISRHHPDRKVLFKAMIGPNTRPPMRPIETFQPRENLSNRKSEQQPIHRKRSPRVVQSKQEAKHCSARVTQSPQALPKAGNGSTRRHYESKKHVSIRCDQGAAASVATQVRNINRFDGKHFSTSIRSRLLSPRQQSSSPKNSMICPGVATYCWIRTAFLVN